MTDIQSKDISRSSSFRFKNILKQKISHSSINSSTPPGSKKMVNSKSFNLKNKSSSSIPKSKSMPMNLAANNGESNENRSVDTTANQIHQDDSSYLAILPVSTNKSASMFSSVSKRRRKAQNVSNSSVSNYDDDEEFLDDDDDNIVLPTAPFNIDATADNIPSVTISKATESNLESKDEFLSDESRFGSKKESHNAQVPATGGIFSTIINTLNFRSHSDLSYTLQDKTTSSKEINTDTDGETHSLKGQKGLAEDAPSSTKDATSKSASPASPTEGINFKPIRQSLLSTLGHGQLSLDHFPVPNSEHDTNTQQDSAKANGSLQLPNSVPSQNGTLQPVTSSSNFFDKTGIPNSQPLAISNSRGLTPSEKLFNLKPKQLSKRGLSPLANRALSPSTGGELRATSPGSLSKGSSFNAVYSLASSNNSLSSDDDQSELKGMNLNHQNNTKRCKKILRLSMTNKEHKKLSSLGVHAAVLSRSTTNAELDSIDQTAVLKRKMDKLSETLAIKLPTERRQESFHSMFSNISATEVLIEDFACACRKDILIQGKAYLSESHFSFHSNIIGLVTHFSVPLSKVLTIKKKKTVGIPNAIELSTMHDKYTFASFMSRDSAFDLITKVWNLLSDSEGNTGNGRSIVDLDMDGTDVESDDPQTDDSDEFDDEKDDDEASTSKPKGSVGNLPKVAPVSSATGTSSTTKKSLSISDSDLDVSDKENMVKDGEDDDEDEFGTITGPGTGASDGAFYGLPCLGPQTHAPTSNGYETDPVDTKIIDEVVPAPLGVVYGLLFGDDVGFVQNLLKVQKNFDISEIPAFENKKRTYSYTKPLNSPVGPKQTRCNVTETIESLDFSRSCLAIQSTETPDVPSGNVFKVKTKIYLNWAANNYTKVFIVTTVVWSGKSWIKGPVEKGAISGQKESLGILVNELKSRIQSAVSSLPTLGKKRPSTRKQRKRRETKDYPEIVPVIEPVQQEPPKPKTLLESITDLLDFKTMLTLILLLLVLWDKLTGPSLKTLQNQMRLEGLSSGSSGMGISFSPESLVSSEIDLWNWIDSRNGDNRVISGPIKSGKSIGGGVGSGGLSSSSSRISGENILESELTTQELNEVIQVLEQRLSGLKKKVDV